MRRNNVHEDVVHFVRPGREFCRIALSMQTTKASAAPTFHVLQYKYVPDILEKRTPFRETHLAKASEKVILHSSTTHPCVHNCDCDQGSKFLVLQAAQGRILLAGALADPVDSALFVWKNSSIQVSI